MQGIYEIFGLSQNMAAFLGGIEDLCAEPYGFMGTSLYNFFGVMMLVISTIVYVLQYHIIDKAKFSGFKWCWIFSGFALVLNAVFVFALVWNLLSNGALKYDCDEEFFKVLLNAPTVGWFAIVNGILGWIWFAIVSSLPYPRKISKNCFRTTIFTR
jgi:hypothetical protein